jgi:hypothetical protein
MVRWTPELVKSILDEAGQDLKDVLGEIVRRRSYRQAVTGIRPAGQLQQWEYICIVAPELGEAQILNDSLTVAFTSWLHERRLEQHVQFDFFGSDHDRRVNDTGYALLSINIILYAAEKMAVVVEQIGRVNPHTVTSELNAAFWNEVLEDSTALARFEKMPAEASVVEWLKQLSPTGAPLKFKSEQGYPSVLVFVDIRRGKVTRERIRVR